MRTPHVEAAYHLPLLPGTNVAILTALAHVIVTEGLVERGLRARALRLGRVPGLGGVRRASRATAPRRSRRSPACPPQTIRGAARLYATGGNGAIYYGLGVTEHSQGSTTVMAIANLAMATGNIGRPGVGVNPLRGQNNVQGACDMGSFPHELSGYRHISDDATRELFEALWGVTLDNEPGLRIPNMLDAAVDGSFKGIYIQGEDILQSDPDTKHVAAGLAAMECVVVQDLFLNETANYAHVFLPGSTFLEKDGTFTNAERRIQRVRKVMAPQQRLCRLGDHAAARQGAGLRDGTIDHPSRDHGRDRAADADLRRRVLRQARRARLGAVAVQRQGAGRHAGHAYRRLRARQGQVRRHRICADRRADRAALPAAAHHRPHPVSQYNVGAQTRRTDNVVWHEEDRLEIHPHDAEQRGIRDGDWVKLASRAGETTLARADHRARRAGRGLHDLPSSRTRRPTSSPPTIRTGRPTARNTR